MIAGSPDPDSIFLYTPAIVEGFDGRFIIATDFGGPGTGKLDDPKSWFGDYPSGNQIRVFLSDDRGVTWRATSARIPMMHEIPYSPDLLRWTFAGLVAVGPSDNESRHYATMMISGDDMFIVSRSGDENARNAHDNNLTTLHKVSDFRRLVY